MPHENEIWSCAISIHSVFWGKYVFLMHFSQMPHLTISIPEGFLTLIAGKNNSFQVVCFDVILYHVALAFLSTYFANVSFLKSVGKIVLAFPHQTPFKTLSSSSSKYPEK